MQTTNTTNTTNSVPKNVTDFHPSNGFRCLYLYNTRNPHRMLGVLIVKKLPSGDHQWGWSMCHKNDQFNKKDARQIAMLRLSPMPEVTLPLTQLGEGLRDTPMNRILVHVSQDPEMPNSLRKAAAARILFYSLIC